MVSVICNQNFLIETKKKKDDDTGINNVGCGPNIHVFLLDMDQNLGWKMGRERDGVVSPRRDVMFGLS